MNIFDEARALYGTIRMCGITQQEIAKRLGVSQSYVANKLRLLQYSPSMQDEITEHGLSERHARALLVLTDEEQRKTALERVAREKLNVAQTEALVDRMRREKDTPARIAGFCASLQSALSGLRQSGIRTICTVENTGNACKVTLELAEG